MQNNHVVLVQKGNKVMLVGGPKGRPISQHAAEVLAKRYLASTFVDITTAYAIQIDALGIENVPIPRGKGARV